MQLIMPVIAPFASREARLGSAVFRHLANAEVSIDGGEAVAGVFAEPGAVGSVGRLGMATTLPSVSVPASSVPADPVGLSVMVNGVPYELADAEPDGATAIRLILGVVRP